MAKSRYKKGGKKSRKKVRSKHIPISILKKRLGKLERVVASRQRSPHAKNKIPLKVLEKRLAKLSRVVKSRRG